MGRGCVKTQNWIDLRGALTIPRTKQIDYRAFYEVVFIWHRPDLAFSHIDGRLRFAKRSIDDGKKVKIAAIDPDFAVTDGHDP